MTSPLLLRGVLGKAVRDRWLGAVFAAVGLGTWLLLAMAVYRDIDLALYTDLPEGIRNLMGIPEGADVASLAYNIVLRFAAPLTLGGLAISAGSHAMAGEERRGTVSVLLANPISRRGVVAAKTGAIALLSIATAAVLWLECVATPALLGVSTAGMRLGAMCVHLTANTMFWGLLAVALGAATGRSQLASGLSTGAMVLAYVAAGLLPLVQPLAGAVRIVPWHYFDGADPLVDGVSWPHLAMLSVGAGCLLGAALVGVERRDLRGPSTGESLMGRLRTARFLPHPKGPLGHTTRASRLWSKIVAEHQAVVVFTGLTMFLVMGVLLGPMYVAIDDSLVTFAEDVPEQVLALAGGGDLATPAGWYQSETYSFMAPLSVMVVTIAVGARALCREEDGRTLGMLLANPVPRVAIIRAHIVAMTVDAAVVGAATWSGVVAGTLLAGLDLGPTLVLAATVHSTLLGFVFGALALAVAGVTGGSRLSTAVAVGGAITSHLLASFLPLSEQWASWSRVAPSHYALDADPLVEGVGWGDIAVLAAVATALVGVAIAGFSRRDLA
jgi:ABC-2 type transport system permease protein